MAFLENEKVQSIAENHVKQVRALEEKEARRVLKLYEQSRQNLRDRLDALPGGTFTAQQTRGTLLQVELAIREMNRILADEMSTAAEDIAGVGIDHLVVELNRFNKEFSGAVVPINLDAAVVASDTSNFLFNRYQTSLEAYGQDLRSTIATEITNAAIEEVPFGQITRNLSRFFLGEQWKLERIVRTELHNVYNIGKINGMKDLVEDQIPDLMKALYHPMDSRTADDSKQAAVQNPIVPIDEPFRYTYTRQTKSGPVREERVFMAPPDRPNDRSILIPYREAWG